MLSGEIFPIKALQTTKELSENPTGRTSHNLRMLMSTVGSLRASSSMHLPGHGRRPAASKHAGKLVEAQRD